MHSNKNEQAMTASNNTGEPDTPRLRKKPDTEEAPQYDVTYLKFSQTKLMYESSFMFSHSYSAVPTPLLMLSLLMWSQDSGCPS